MRRFAVLIFTLLSLTFQGIAQDDELNTLLRELKVSKEDTSRINILHQIQDSYLDADNDSALYFNKMAEGLIDKLKAASMRHRCYHAFVKIYHAKFNNEMALDYCLKAIAAANDSFQKATSYRAVFSLYFNVRKKDSALKYAAYAVDLTERIKDSNNIATMYGNLCRIYNEMELYEKAEAFGKKGIAAGNRYKDYKGLLISMNNLGNCYLSLGKNKEAISIFEQQLIAGQKYKRIRSVSNALTNLGVTYYNVLDKTNLERITARIKEMAPAFDPADKMGQSYHQLIFGYNFILNKQYAAAEKEMLKGLEIAEKDSITAAMETIYQGLSSLKYLMQDLAGASFYEDKWLVLNDTLQKQDLREYSMDLETKYETESKIARIKLQASQLKEKSIINYILIGSAAALFIISVLLFINYRHKQRLQLQRIHDLETRQLLTATEAVLKGEEQERSRLAKDLHDGLGGMLSGIKYSFNTMKGNLILTPENAKAFERSMDMLDSSIKEMRRVAHNMMPEALVKFGLDTALKDFCNDISNSGALQVSYQSIGVENAKIDQTTAITIYRIVQELINNTMKHAVAQTALVQLSKAENQMSVTVEDDGKGFDTAMLSGSRGIGWSSIQNRVEFLKGKLDVHSQPGKGTSVLIELTV